MPRVSVSARRRGRGGRRGRRPARRFRHRGASGFPQAESLRWTDDRRADRRDRMAEHRQRMARRVADQAVARGGRVSVPTGACLDDAVRSAGDVGSLGPPDREPPCGRRWPVSTRTAESAGGRRIGRPVEHSRHPELRRQLQRFQPERWSSSDRGRAMPAPTRSALFAAIRGAASTASSMGLPAMALLDFHAETAAGQRIPMGGELPSGTDARRWSRAR